MLPNLNLGINNVITVKCPEQNNNFECGENVLINCKVILDYNSK